MGLNHLQTRMESYVHILQATEHWKICHKSWKANGMEAIFHNAGKIIWLDILTKPCC